MQHCPEPTDPGPSPGHGKLPVHLLFEAHQVYHRRRPFGALVTFIVPRGEAAGAAFAGDQAELAPKEAEQHYRRALDLAESVGDGPAASQALEKLGWVLASTVRYDEALAALEQAADAYGARNEPENAGRVEARIAQTHFRRGTPEEGIARLSSHLQSQDRPVASEGVRRSLSALYCAQSRKRAAHMQYAECLDAAERGATLSRKVEDIGSLGEAEMMRGIVLLWLDAPDEGVTTLEKAILLAERSGAIDTLDTLCNAFLVLHITYRVRGEFDRSHECGERGTAIAEKTVDTDMLAMYTTNLGLQLFYVGDWRGARAFLERAVELARGTQPSYFSCMPFVHLGVLCTVEGVGLRPNPTGRTGRAKGHAAGGDSTSSAATRRLGPDVDMRCRVAAGTGGGLCRCW